MEPFFTQARPIIVAGMHRSGTRLLADMLTELGVFMGADQQGDSESTTFLRINEALFHQCATFWCEPMPVHVTLAQPEHVERLAELARHTLAAEMPRYVGDSNWRLDPSSGQMPPFGWKDPRNTFTLPVWKRLFPNCKVIHLVRHGVDAAASLARRQRSACLSVTGEAVPSPLSVFQDPAFGVLSTRRGWTVAEAFAMWEEYVEKARLESAELAERAFEIRFEDLVTQPEQFFDRLARFCGIEPTTDHSSFCDAIRSERAYAFRDDPELVAFGGSVRKALERYGYSA